MQSSSPQAESTLPPSADARLLRLGIAEKLAVLFVALLLAGTGAIVLAERAFDKHVELAQFVSDAGRLRMLSQSMAYSAHRFDIDRVGAARELTRLAAEYEATLTQLEEKSAAIGGEGFAAMAEVHRHWPAYAQTLDRLMHIDAKAENALAALGSLDDAARSTLRAEEAAVAMVLARQEDLRRTVRLRLFAVLLLGLGLTGLVYWRIHARIVGPLAHMAHTARRIAAGELAARVRHNADDEIGDLARAFNDSAANVEQLLERHRHAEKTINDSEVRHRTLWELANDGVVMIGRDGVIGHNNPAADAMFGYAPGELVGQPIAVLQPERLREAHREGFARYLASGRRAANWQSLEVRALRKDGVEIPVEISFTHMRLSGGEWLAAFFRDISRRTEALDALRLRDRAIESTGEGIMISDALADDHPTLYVNPAFGRITGYEPQEVIGRNGRFFLGDDLGDTQVGALRHMLRAQEDGTVVLRCYRKDGTPFWNELSVSPVRDDDGRVTHTISIFKDITERRRQEQELIKSVHHDALTGLANRTLLYDRIDQAISVAHRHGRKVGALFVDIDNFKLINDSLGHHIGDILLQETARRLGDCLRDGDTVARLGSDEFVLLLADMEREEDVALIADRVLSAMVLPFEHSEGELYVSASVGASFYPRDGTDSETLVKHADIAMYRAKDQGRNNFQVFTAEMQSRIDQRLSLETHLRKALERGEFELFYQPQVSLESGRIVGAEALIRWRHPELGLVPPVQFIPLAEETGLIVPIGEWVIDTACAQIAAWQADGLRPPRVAVNLSARQFHQQNLTRIVDQSLRLHRIGPGQLELEMTESMVMQDPEGTILVLRQLKDLGVSLSLDDFGTGYSSLSHLRRFPIDVLKVDQSFVRDVTNNSDDAAIAASIIALAHSLQLAVVAEGVETQAQLHYLKRQQCDIIQGYYFGKPVPAHEFSALLASGRRLSDADLLRASQAAA